MSRIGELLLDQVGGIGELFLVLVLDGCLVDLPHAVALTVVDNAAAIGREVDGALLLGGVGDLLGGLVVHCGDIDVAVHHKRHFLAAGRHADGGSPVGLDLADEFLVVTVGGNGDVDALRLAALTQGIDFAVVAVAQRAVASHTEETHGVVLVVGELHGLPADGVFVDIEGAVLLAQVVITVAVGSPAGRAVLAVEGGEFGELAVALEPDVACDGAGVVLAERVLIALDVMVEDVALAVDAQVLHRQRREQVGPAAAGAHLIDLREGAAGKQDGLCRGHVGRLKQDRLPVEEAQRRLIAAVGGQALGRAAVLVHDIHVQAALA